MTTDPADIQFRAAEISDVQPIAEMLQPYVLQRKLLRRTHAELAELVRHAFVAIQAETGTNTADTNSLSTTDQYIRIVGFCAVEVYSSKLAEIQSLAVANGYQGTGIGKQLVQLCVERARSLGVMEVMAISANDTFLQSCGFDYSLPDQKRALFFPLRPRPTGE